MSLKDEIYKPVVKIVPDYNSSKENPTNCIFEVHVKFKLVNGMVPYPDLIYSSERRDIGRVQSNTAWIMSVLESNVEKHKRKHNFVNQKQTQIDNFLNETWGE